MRTSILALVLTLLSIAAPDVAPAADRPTVVRIGVAAVGTGGRPVSGWSYSSVVAANGSLENELKPDGIEVRWIYFSGAGPAVNEALANGQLDFAFEGDLPSLVARAGGLRTKVILAHTRFEPTYVAVPADSPARTLEDLKGKRVAVFKGTNLQLALYRVLESKSLKDSEFKLINMSTNDGNAALLSKDIDAQVSGSDVFPLVERGVARIVYSTQGDPRLGRVSHLLVTEEFAARYPAVVQRVVNSVLRDAAWLADEANRARAYQIWTKSGFGLPAWKGDWDSFVLRDRASPLLDEFFRVQYRRLLDAARGLRLVRKDFDVDQWLDATYLNRGLAELNLARVWRELDSDGKPKAPPTGASAAAR
ncbi:ABC transporter substrate-binding protein [Anaeromyxobacter oryzae]|uniref:Sulfate ester-binding protein n=1 Tax=Anaeromyxobacter oryzae TaxID=2918170 RepID=A0ABM7WSD3_9BACT|nr:ABC transporter substrate-binding protein [Anaeromyxobacter oryzae]BDG02392.1 sulfate ester-binding protein [Anaeromyxobacter oryzae]